MNSINNNILYPETKLHKSPKKLQNSINLNPIPIILTNDLIAQLPQICLIDNKCGLKQQKALSITKQTNDQTNLANFKHQMQIKQIK